MCRKTRVVYFSSTRLLAVMETLQVGDLTKESQKSNKRIKIRDIKRDKQAPLGRARLVPTVHFHEQPNWRLLACPMFLHWTRHHSDETIIVLFAPRKTKAGVGWSRSRRGKIVFVHFYERPKYLTTHWNAVVHSCWNLKAGL